MMCESCVSSKAPPAFGDQGLLSEGRSSLASLAVQDPSSAGMPSHVAWMLLLALTTLYPGEGFLPDPEGCGLGRGLGRLARDGWRAGLVGAAS